jgi:hypothetical protein
VTVEKSTRVEDLIAQLLAGLPVLDDGRDHRDDVVLLDLEGRVRIEDLPPPAQAEGERLAVQRDAALFDGLAHGLLRHPVGSDDGQRRGQCNDPPADRDPPLIGDPAGLRRQVDPQEAGEEADAGDQHDGSEEVGDRIADAHVGGGARGVHALRQPRDPRPHRVLGARERRGAGERAGEEPGSETLLEIGAATRPARIRRPATARRGGESPAVLAQRAEEARPACIPTGMKIEAEGRNLGPVQKPVADTRPTRFLQSLAPGDAQPPDQQARPYHE